MQATLRRRPLLLVGAFLGLATLFVGGNILLRATTPDEQTFLLYWQPYFFFVIYGLAGAACVAALTHAKRLYSPTEDQARETAAEDERLAALAQRVGMPLGVARAMRHMQAWWGVGFFAFVIATTWAHAWPVFVRLFESW